MPSGRRAGLILPDLHAMRAYPPEAHRRPAGRTRPRGGFWSSTRSTSAYATDTTNMQLWNTHNPFFSAPCMVWRRRAHGAVGLTRTRPSSPIHKPAGGRGPVGGASMFYFRHRRPGAARRRAEFAGQVAEVLAGHAGSNRRLAVDKILLHGAKALEAAEFDLHDGRGGHGKGPRHQGPRRDMRDALRVPCLRDIRRGDGGGLPGP